MHRWAIERLSARQLIGSIYNLNVDLPDDELRERLRRRPGYDAERVERKVGTAAKLRHEADVNIGRNRVVSR